MHFREWKYLNSLFVHKGPVNNNGLVPSRWQFIIWTKDDLFTNAYMRHSSSVVKIHIESYVFKYLNKFCPLLSHMKSTFIIIGIVM